MNQFIDTEFYEKYIKEIPIEEQIRRQVRAECYYMDKADIYEWITQNQIKIMNLQSKIDKAIDYLYEHSQYNDGDGVHYIKEDEYCVDYLLDILKEDK